MVDQTHDAGVPQDPAAPTTQDENENTATGYEEQSVNSKAATVKLEDELKQSFIDYAMSVIVDRALPDVRDGLKPVHRRVLYDMYDLKIWHTSPTKKSARVVGDVIGRFHPHGDAAVYETIVRMAQWFSMRAPLIFGQGNFGNLDGDGAAAMRYTEVRMTKIAEMMLQDIDKETVNTYPNYDGNEQIPEVLPTRYPNLLVNGSAGIAVGMATSIPPHNLSEVIDGTIAMLDKPDISLEELMRYIPGPDFPTGGLIISSPDIKKAYATGRGRCIIRARTHVETDKQGRTTIYVDEIPYMVNKSAIVKEIADLVREKKIEGIAEVNDLSDKDNQVRIAIDLKRDAYEEAVLNNLYQHTSMQSSFSFNMIALVNNHPEVLSLPRILQEFLKFRREVVTRRTVYLLRQDRRKAFLDEGLIVAKANIHKIIDIITNASNAEDAKDKLMSLEWEGELIAGMIEYDEQGENICLPIGTEKDRGLVGKLYHLAESQVKAILALPLSRLTHLAAEEIQGDYKTLKANIKSYLEILNSTERMNQVIREELLEAKKTFQDARRSEFIIDSGSISKADLITRQAVLITLSAEGYIKYQDLSLYEAMNRGTKGNNAAKLKEEDYIITSTVCNSHDSLLCFTNYGRCFVSKVYDLPTSPNRTWRGRPIQNLFNLQPGEQVRRLLAISDTEDTNNTFIVFGTAKGQVKRTKLSQYKHVIRRSNGTCVKSINLEGVKISDTMEEGKATSASAAAAQAAAAEAKAAMEDAALDASSAGAVAAASGSIAATAALGAGGAADTSMATVTTSSDADELVAVELSHGEDDIILFSSNGKCMRFCEFFEARKSDDADSADTDSNDISDDEEVLDAGAGDSTALDAADSNADDAADSADDSGDESVRIAKELAALQPYLNRRLKGSGLRPSSRTSGTVKGIKLINGARLAGLIVVPANLVADSSLNYLIITQQGMGKRGRIIAIPGKMNRGSQGVTCCSAVARNDNIVGVITAYENSDYLVFSNNGSVLRLRVGDLTVRSRGAGYIRLKRLTDGEHIVGMQEIAPDVVAAINESAENRAAEKLRQNTIMQTGSSDSDADDTSTADENITADDTSTADIAADSSEATGDIANSSSADSTSTETTNE